MKNSDFIIRTLRMLPEVYSDESRDFLVFTRLADAIFNSCKWNATTMLYVAEARHINATLLKLLADKLGLDLMDANELKDDEVRLILQCLPYLIRYKGSYRAVEGLVNMYFKLYHILGSYVLEITNEGAVILGITLGGHTIILGMETLSLSITLLKIMAKYLLPPGYQFFVYFYTKAENIASFLYSDNVLLLYMSDNLNSMVDLEIPDFIVNAKYSWMDSKTEKEAPGRLELLISAVDAHLLNSIYTAINEKLFIGFIKDEDISLICKNYKNALSYDSTLDPTLSSHIITPDDYSKYSVAKFNVDEKIEYKILMPSYRFEKIIEDGKIKTEFLSWKDIRSMSLAIANTETELNGTHSTGEIYLITTTNTLCKFNKLTFKNSYKITDYTNILNNLPSASTMNEFDYCCLLDKTDTAFWHKDKDTEIVLTIKDAVEKLPMQCEINDLRYNLRTTTYFRCINDALNNNSLLIPISFQDSAIVNNITYITNRNTGTITADGVAYGESVFTIQKQLKIKKGHVYLLLGSPENGSAETFLLCIDSKLFNNSWLSDFGNGIIAKATANSNEANVRIVVLHGTELSNKRFSPELFDLTEHLGITEAISVSELTDLLWIYIKEGPSFLGLQNHDIILPNDSVVWRHEGNYYICRKTSNNVKYWEKYTEPLFLLKLLQSKGQL